MTPSSENVLSTAMIELVKALMVSPIETLRQQMTTEPVDGEIEPMTPYQMQMRYMERWKRKRR